MRKISILLFVCVIVCSQYGNGQNRIKEIRHLVQFVDNRIGVIDNRGSNCVIGPQVPFGTINPSPETPEGGQSGYTPGKPVRGFAQIHVSGTGWGKYGHFLVSPQVGLHTPEGDHDSPISDELATASYYRVRLDRYGITTEVTPARHAAIYRFTFPKTDSAYVLLDVTHSLARDIITSMGGTVYSNKVTIDTASKDKVCGMIRFEGGFGEGVYQLYFCALFSQRAGSIGVWKNENLLFNSTSAELADGNDRIGAFLKFDSRNGNTIQMKIAISFKSVEKAESYLLAEIPDWNFIAVKKTGESIWDTALSSILLEGASEKQNKIFYTAMYHSMLMPRNKTGDFEGWQDNESIWDDLYTVWDSWRTLYPLMVLINPDMIRDNVASFINRFKHNNYVKDAFIAGIDMFAEQGGNNVDNVIADAILKEVPGIDVNEAYKILKYDADTERNGWQGWSNKEPYNTLNGAYKKTGWIPASVMSCSRTLEYAYNDFCIASVAKKLGLNDDYKKYLKRSKLWVNLWNPELESKGFKGFICPKDENGNWVPIDPAYFWGSWKNYFYEGNSWTYSLFVPHQAKKLIKLNGGNDQFAKKLDFAFRNNLIELDNEPSFLAVRLFDIAGRPDLNCYWVNNIMNNLFDETGVPGNDDSGAMSTWYIFSAMGFFPFAGQETYYINAPFCKKIIMQRPGGKDIIIETPNASEKNIYVKSFYINGKKYKDPCFNHRDIVNGATLKFDVTDHPVSQLNY
jgi:predicted alpha-1,2-mannosidase